MFTLDADIPEVQAAMFTHGRGVIVDIEIWHKRIRHMNIQMLKSMQTQSIVVGLPKFRVDGRIAQVSLNAITHMQAKAITRELRKREREGQAGTSQNLKP